MIVCLDVIYQLYIHTYICMYSISCEVAMYEYIGYIFNFDLVLKGLLQKLCTNVRTASKQSMVCYKWFIITTLFLCG